MKSHVLGLDGKQLKAIEMPSAFSQQVDANLIKRAVLSGQANAKQPKGKYLKAGLDNTAVYIGYRGLPGGQKSINTGHARLPRMKNRGQLMSGRVAGVSQAVGGHAAHPPKVEAKTREELNKKERKKALLCAISATASKQFVQVRGNSQVTEVPMVLSNEFEKLEKTQEVTKVLKHLKVWDEIVSAKKKREMRAGKQKSRGNKYKRKKSILIVVGKSSPAVKSCRNLEGVDIVEARNLSVELLAPGTKPGRLTLWTEDAVTVVHKLWGDQ